MPSITSTSPALNVAQDYAQAWTSGDIDKALSFLADNIVCEAPAGRVEGLAAHRTFTEEFVAVLVNSTIIKVLADDTNAAIVYSFDTAWVKNFRCIEYMTVEDGKIKHILTVFDRLPAAEAARSSAS
jgi:ketosteroid isomerase-like protein